ncbi:MAG: VanW family protein [Chthoniobacterales bacterium]
MHAGGFQDKLRQRMSEPGGKHDERAHTHSQAFWFWFRAWCFRLARLATEFFKRSPRLRRDSAGNFSATLARSVSSLYAEGASPTERLWQIGKVENLRAALRGIDGVVVPAGATFSFWRQVGPPWRTRGFVVGRELREGCLIANVGGGLCQLSNALYDCALKSGVEIVERHRHTQVIAGSLAEINRDATIFWNYVDLRFRAPFPFRIHARLDNERLHVSFHAAAPHSEKNGATPAIPSNASTMENCATCGIDSCLRHVGPGADGAEETAVLVDEFQPEFDEWLAGLRDTAHLLVPMRHSRWHRASYAWNDRGWRSVRDVPLASLVRAGQSRRLSAQGAARQRALLAHDQKLAAAFATRAPWRCSRAIVAQNLLPHLHASGWTGGRAVTVFLFRWPIRLLQQRLDEAASRHPQSPTLADFRADPALADAEWTALEQAESLVTCHARLAEIWPEKTMLLPWKLPHARSMQAADAPLVVFPASGLARKGAIELRDAMRAVGLPLRIVGARQLEKDENFWHGVTLSPAAPHWLDGASVVVLPAWIEHRPRRLFEAIAAGVPVIATDACGLHDWPAGARVAIVPCGDREALIREIENAIAVAAPQ